MAANDRIAVSIVCCLATLLFLKIFVRKGGNVDILLENEAYCLSSATFKGGGFYCDNEGEFMGRIHEITLARHPRGGLRSLIRPDHGGLLGQPCVISTHGKIFNGRCL